MIFKDQGNVLIHLFGLSYFSGLLGTFARVRALSIGAFTLFYTSSKTLGSNIMLEQDQGLRPKRRKVLAEWDS